MSYQKIIYDVDEFGIARITLNDPGRMNMLSWPLLTEMDDALVKAEKDDNVKVIILRGAGRCFSSGYDLEEASFLAGDEPKGKRGEEWRGSLWNSRAHVQGHVDYYFRIWDLWKIVIAQVHGYCLAGGTEPAMMCDLMTISEDCTFGNTAARWIDVGDTQVLCAWHVGLKRAMELQMGRMLTGREGQEWGLANYCFPEAKLEEETTKIAKRIAAIDQELLMLHKTLVHRTFDAMGFRMSCQYGSELDSMGHGRLKMRQDPNYNRFRELAKDVGLAKALKEMHAMFGGLKAGGLNEFNL